MVAFDRFIEVFPKVDDIQANNERILRAKARRESLEPGRRFAKTPSLRREEPYAPDQAVDDVIDRDQFSWIRPQAVHPFVVDSLAARDDAVEDLGLQSGDTDPLRRVELGELLLAGKSGLC